MEVDTKSLTITQEKNHSKKAQENQGYGLGPEKPVAAYR